ncbi:PAS domain S-box protein [Desulfopila sp. IMCC35006]|uniref:PAS domain S-box protein n=1 Tax=Desulfopila sp. IMCC35006 TaxID=2569542 RepID=UPI00142EB1F7|nr:PAS domain S-box protein [Desulfopila sp. IMCC35006]
MKVKRENALERIYSHLVLVGAVFVILYWFIEAAVHSWFFDGGSFLLHVTHPDKHEIWMRLIVVALLIIFSLYGQNIINRLRRTEAALIEREKDSLRILENNPAAIVLVDCESRQITYANNNALNLIETTVTGLQGKVCHNYLCRTQKGQCPILDLGQRMDLSERELLTKEKTVIPILKSVTKIQYQDKPHLLEAFFDISEQKKMQQALRQAHAELDQIFQTATVGMRLIDSDFNILKINQTFAELSGVAPEDAVGKKCFEIFAGSMCHQEDCPLQKVLDGQQLSDYEVSKIRSDGSVLICNLTVTRFEGVDGMIGVVEAFKDITELKKIQHALQSEHDRLHGILFHQFESVGIISDQYHLEYQNELLKQQTNGRTPCHCYEVFRDRVAPCDECFMQKAFASAKIQRFEFDSISGHSFQHTYTPFVDNKGQNKVVVSRRDISERKASLAMAISSERLAALGELAAGVAHEINNPINGIINYGQMLVNKTKHEDPLNTIASRIIKEGDRIAAIVASLLSFSRRENEKNSLVSIRELLQESLTLTGAQLKKDGIALSVNMAENLFPVAAIGQEIEQVFLNIINNSRYALNEKYPQSGDRKKLDINVSIVSTSNDDIVVRTCFKDYGTGIPADLIEKVVDPFFSTKPKGKGTGLGLTISRRIIENHSGTIDIDSIAGEYTEVTVDFPAQCGKEPS